MELRCATRRGDTRGVNAISPMAASPLLDAPRATGLQRKLLRQDRFQRGVSLLDTCAALALTATATLALLSGVRPLACAIEVEAARSTLTSALLEARRSAYLRADNTTVEAAVGSNQVRVMPAGSTRSLGQGVVLTSVPADGNVQFRANGLADNATLQLGCGRATASVVVNQRGGVR